MKNNPKKQRLALLSELCLVLLFGCGTESEAWTMQPMGGSASASNTTAPSGAPSPTRVSPSETAQPEVGVPGVTVAPDVGSGGGSLDSTPTSGVAPTAGGSPSVSGGVGGTETPESGGVGGAGGASGEAPAAGGVRAAGGMSGAGDGSSGGSGGASEPFPEGCVADPLDTSSDPVLVSTIDLRGASGNPGLRLGDLDGDGRMEFVVGQPVPQSSLDGNTPQRVVAVTAFDLKGEQLWQHGTPNNAHIATSDIPIQVYDLDGDGKSEVFVNMSNTQMTVLDGETGEVLRTIALPATGSNDSIAFANLRGTEWPQDILVKDRYTQVWAITGIDSDAGPAGTVLWTHRDASEAGVGHYPLVYDWNDDGRDEVLVGYQFLDSGGNSQWSVTTLGLHNDTAFTGDLDGNPDNGYEIVVCGDYAAAVEWETGDLIWQDTNTVEVQQGGMGDYRPDLPGLEVVLLDRLRTEALGLKSNNWLVDQSGSVLAREDRPNNSGWLTVTENLNNWDGSGGDFIFSYRRDEGVLLYDGNLDTVATFPYDGPSPENFAVHTNLCGDEREEVIVYDEENAWIYSNGGCDLDAPPCQASLPQQHYLYNWSIYTGWVTPGVKFYTPGSQR